MTKKKRGMPDRFPNLSAHTTATKELAYEDSYSTNFKLKKFTKETNTDYGKYESFNVVSETGDSIYSPQFEEFATLDDGGQVFISETAIEEIVKRIIDQRLGPSLNIKNDN